jgi:hypothetical protein
MALKNYEEAVTDCNWAVFLRPKRGLAYYVRARANVNLGLREEVCADLSKASDYGIQDTEGLKKQFCR